MRASFSKWQKLESVLAQHTIEPGNDQVLVFSEYVDTARWLLQRFQAAGFDAEILYGDLGLLERDQLQQRFLDGDFDVLVSTDAGGEGIDLQSANVMVNWDIPWSMVRLEQRMGRLHRIGQTRDVFIYHLVSPSHDGRTCSAGNAAKTSSTLANRCRAGCMTSWTPRQLGWALIYPSFLLELLGGKQATRTFPMLGRGSGLHKTSLMPTSNFATEPTWKRPNAA